MLNSSNAKAYAVLAILFDLYGGDCNRLQVKGYSNGRENGFHVYLHPNMKLAVSFSENRNTDSIVVYFGESYLFNPQGNGPSEEMYKNAKHFSGSQYAEAALWIKDYFEEVSSLAISWLKSSLVPIGPKQLLCHLSQL